MGDSSNLTLYARADIETLKKVRRILNNYGGTYIYDDELGEDLLSYGANDVSVGSAEQCFKEILGLIEKGDEDHQCEVCKGSGEHPKNPENPCLRCQGEGYYFFQPKDFPFYVHDDPLYEWMGSMYWHAPGLEDIEGAECDSNGRILVNTDEVIRLIDQATDLDSLRVQIQNYTGSEHAKAMDNYKR